MKPRHSVPSSTLRYLLYLRPADLEAVAETLVQYSSMMTLLEGIAEREGIKSDVVRLQKLAYESIRSETQLPAQLVLLGIRDFAARRSSGEELPGIPLDDKLYTVKGAASLTLSTVQGRVTVHYDVAGYGEGWRGSAPARLVPTDVGFEIIVGVNPVIRSAEEKSMAYEGILSRVGRLVAGFAHATVERAEQKDPVAVVEQAIREIDREAESARAALGKHTAEQHRLESRTRELDAELSALSDKIATALKEGRDDLAKAGIERQIDIEAQITALQVAITDVSERIHEAQGAVQAVIAARREGEARLAELKRSLAKEQASASSGNGTSRSASSTDKALRSLEAISRVTGVPSSGGNPHASQMNELERMHRDKTVEERLAAFKAKAKE
ncbi:PspA/IM30 family protein [Microvirga terricola]|uniref:PspA/IM30 family protein n=1 Tax=Microvirga terricola TaxID=2719797 RepID=A0ABX0V9F8_9HYPH|nr:PspA/IM30 family protein [Microvirga terricola]NIX76348.1 PspA/IM30 family protein [Microvirga terricola]